MKINNTQQLQTLLLSLNLEDTQRGRIDKLMGAIKENSCACEDAMLAYTFASCQLALSRGYDEFLVADLCTDASQALVDGYRVATDLYREIYNLLTREQREFIQAGLGKAQG